MKVTGYHGTTRSRAIKILGGGFQDIAKRPRWLGPGIYFFQDAPAQAANWATALGSIRSEEPVLFKAEIDISDAVDFLDAREWSVFKAVVAEVTPPPQNQLGPISLFQQPPPPELGWNYEDDHYVNLFAIEVEKTRPVTAIRAAFIEGEPLHERSWLFDKAHVQLCVRKPSVISALTEIDMAHFVSA